MTDLSTLLAEARRIAEGVRAGPCPLCSTSIGEHDSECAPRLAAVVEALIPVVEEAIKIDQRIIVLDLHAALSTLTEALTGGPHG